MQRDAAGGRRRACRHAVRCGEDGSAQDDEEIDRHVQLHGSGVRRRRQWSEDDVGVIDVRLAEAGKAGGVQLTLQRARRDVGQRSRFDLQFDSQRSCLKPGPGSRQAGQVNVKSQFDTRFFFPLYALSRLRAVKYFTRNGIFGVASACAREIVSTALSFGRAVQASLAGRGWSW